MSDAPPLPKRLQEWFTEKRTSDACPMCRNEKWGLLRDYMGGTTFQVGGSQGPQAFALVCLNCGFTRWHVEEVLADPQFRSDGEIL